MGGGFTRDLQAGRVRDFPAVRLKRDRIVPPKVGIESECLEVEFLEQQVGSRISRCRYEQKHATALRALLSRFALEYFVPEESDLRRRLINRSADRSLMSHCRRTCFCSSMCTYAPHQCSISPSPPGDGGP